MARFFTVVNDSNFCRDCGGRMKSTQEFSWCENVEIKNCHPLKRADRNYCEHDGHLVDEGGICSSCHGQGSNP